MGLFTSPMFPKTLAMAKNIQLCTGQSLPPTTPKRLRVTPFLRRDATTMQRTLSEQDGEAEWSDVDR